MRNPKAMMGEHEGKTFIHKKYLRDGEYYAGTCRNASVARWDAKENKFYYWRTKFGQSFIEDIRHPEDDDKYDLFYPQVGPIRMKEIETPNHKEST